MEEITKAKLNRWTRMMLGVIPIGLALFLVMTLLWGFSDVTPALADPGDLYVDGSSGGDNPTCGTIGEPCQTISYTLNNRAGESDTIHIAAGTYTENLTINGITVTLRGGYTISGTLWISGTGETIVNGNNADRVFVIQGNNSVLEDLTITGGYAPGGSCFGSGVWVTDGNVAISSSTITGNYASCGGAGIEVNNNLGPAHLTLKSSIVSHNNSDEFGGLHIWGNSTTADVIGTTFHNNSAGSGGGGITVVDGGYAFIADTYVYSNTADHGGGISVRFGSSAVITGTRILSNTANEGGGVDARINEPTVVITGSLISGNISYYDGAGLAAYDGAQVTMSDVEVANNEVLTITEAGNGGGLYFRRGAQGTLTDMWIHDNTAAEGGGGLFFDDDSTKVAISNSWIANNTAIGNYGASGGGLGASEGKLSIIHCTVEGNSAPNNYGGGLFVWTGGSIDVFDSKIINNTTKDHGGAIHTDQATVNLTNTLVAGNQASSGDANVLSIDDSEVTIMNSTISDNNPGGAQAVLLWSGGLTVTNSILWNNALNLQADPSCPACFDVTYSNIEGGWTGTGNINAIPLFLGDGNYHLGIGSPCIDTGTPIGAPMYDIEGTARDALPDMGAYEFKLYDLTVSLAGSGSGSVNSLPEGIDCGSDCAESYANGTVVTLTASADTGSTFTGWSGACSGMNDCTVAMTESKDVTATFTLEQYDLSVFLDGTGNGSVTSIPTGIDCGTSCSESFDYGTVITLTATTDVGSTFDGWSGACSGMGDCNVIITETKVVTATFNRIEIYLPLVSR